MQKEAIDQIKSHPSETRKSWKQVAEITRDKILNKVKKIQKEDEGGNNLVFKTA